MSSRSPMSLLLIFLSVLLLLCVAAAAKFATDKAVAENAFQRYAATVPPPVTDPRLVRASERAREGDMRGAAAELEGVATPGPGRGASGPSGAGQGPGGGPAGVPGAPGRGGPEQGSPLRITDEAKQLLEQHPELREKAFGAVAMAMARRRAGQDVSEGRELFQKAMEAAAAGDARRTSELLDESAKAMAPQRGPMGGGRGPGGADRGPGGADRGPGGGDRGAVGGDRMKRALEGLERQVAQAEKQGAKVGQLKGLLAQLRKATESGDRERARELLTKLTAQMREQRLLPGGGGPAEVRRPAEARTPGGRPRAGPGWPGGPGGQGGPRGGPRGPGGGPMARGPGQPGEGSPLPSPFFGAVLTTLRNEEDKLARLDEHLFNADRALLEKNQAQVREILGRAEHELAAIEEGRRRLAGMMRESPEPGGAARQPGVAERLGRVLAQVRELLEARGRDLVTYSPERAPEAMLELLDQVREMSDLEYAAARPTLWDQVLAKLRGPEPELPPIPGLGRPPRAGPEREPTEATTGEEQVRAKLRLAREPYEERRAAGEDVSEVSEMLAETRELLAAGQYEEASSLMDEVLERLGVPVGPELSPAAGAPGRRMHRPEGERVN